MRVKKRSGELKPLDLTQIRKQTKPATEGLEGTSYEEIEESVELLLRDEMPTTELQEILIQSALGKIDVDTPKYTYVAARLSLYDIYHRIKRVHKKAGSGDVYKLVTLEDYFSQNEYILKPFRSKYSKTDMETFQGVIDGDRDKLYDYMGLVTMRDRYLAKNPTIVNSIIKEYEDSEEELTEDMFKEAVTELPQHMHMSIAMFLMQDEDPIIRRALVVEAYDMFSKLEYINPTPVNSNARLVTGGLISCLLGTVPDSIEGIFEMAKEVAFGSKIGSGWGIDWSRVRSYGSTIGINVNAAGGKIPFLKIFNDIAIAVDQNGNRPGAFAVYIETWDIEIFDFLDLKKKNGDDRKRAQDIFIAISASDLFMEREAVDGEWTLFDPRDVRDLTECFGDEFKEKYLAYEADFKKNPHNYNPNTRTVNITEIMREVVSSYNNEGQPFWFFKDTVNGKHLHKQLGIIRSANLCTEVMQPTDEEHTAVCNLGSINLARVNTPEDLIRVTKLGMRCMDNSIDLTPYPSEKARRSQEERRSVGLGMLGEAEMIANKQIYYGSDEHIELISSIYKLVADTAYEASKELAKEKGSCIIDGLRNAYRMATAPNSTSGLFAGTTNSHEPVYNKIWVEENKLGNFIMTAPNININNYEYYQNPYEVDMFKQLEVCAARQYASEHGVDMGISQNIYLDPEGLKASTIREVIRYAWQLGLKTIYYLRSKPPKVNAVKNEKIACVGCAN
jgi:ribonucleoside-diphosphate reductase alpha chain